MPNPLCSTFPDEIFDEIAALAHAPLRRLIEEEDSWMIPITSLVLARRAGIEILSHEMDPRSQLLEYKEDGHRLILLSNTLPPKEADAECASVLAAVLFEETLPFSERYRLAAKFGMTMGTLEYHFVDFFTAQLHFHNEQARKDLRKAKAIAKKKALAEALQS